MSGRRLRVLLLALPLVVLAGCASHRQQHAGAASERTVFRTFHAYRTDGELAVQVADVAYGHCWTTSITAPMSGAYRCLSGNAILDPCFPTPHPSNPVQVACIADPWSQAEVLRVTSVLPKPQPSGDRAVRPWAISLGNGAHCVASSGMVPRVRGVDLGYHCRNGWDAGALNTSHAMATAEYGNDRTNQLRDVRVTTIWRV